MLVEKQATCGHDSVGYKVQEYESHRFSTGKDYQDTTEKRDGTDIKLTSTLNTRE